MKIVSELLSPLCGDVISEKASLYRGLPCFWTHCCLVTPYGDIDLGHNWFLAMAYYLTASGGRFRITKPSMWRSHQSTGNEDVHHGQMGCVTNNHWKALYSYSLSPELYTSVVFCSGFVWVFLYVSGTGANMWRFQWNSNMYTLYNASHKTYTRFVVFCFFVVWLYNRYFVSEMTLNDMKKNRPVRNHNNT